MKRLAIGTYSFGFTNGMDTPAKLRAAASFGYTGIEFLEHEVKGADVGALKALLAETGLEATSMHCMPDGMSEVLPVFAAIGGRFLVAPMIQFGDRAEALAVAKRLEEKGREAQAFGVTVGYHNHTEEFTVDEGLTLEEHLLQNTDPALVSFQLDCGWATAAGADCPAFIRKYSGRFRAIHVKENDRLVGPQKPLRATESRPPMPKMERDASGNMIMTDELKALFAAMKDRMSVQCRMGDPTSRIDWKAVKAATDAQGNDCLWVVERENDYADDLLRCLREDAEWLKANL